MPSANLLAMQTAINRIAPVGGFPAVALDGGMGPATAAGTWAALGWVATGKCNGSRCVPASFRVPASTLISQLVSDSGAIDQTAIMQHDTEIAQLLNGAASAVGIGMGAPPMIATGGGGFPATPVTPINFGPKTAGFAMNLQNTWKGMATWQKVGVGIGVFAGFLFIRKQLKQRTSVGA